MNGIGMKLHLEALGIRAQKVIRKRETDCYVADFYVPEMKMDVLPAKEWANKIASALTGATIIQMDEMRAEWRDGSPIILSSVTFEFVSHD